MGFFILLISAVIGLGIVFWLLKNEAHSPAAKLPEEAPKQAKPVKDPFRKLPNLNIDNQTAQKTKSIVFSHLFTEIKEKLKNIKVPPIVQEKLQSILKNKFSLSEKKATNPQRTVKDLFELTEKIRLVDEPLNNIAHAEPKPQINGTASLKTAPVIDEPKPVISLSKEEEKSVEREIELDAELSDLKEKYERLDRLFNEKSKEASEAKEALEHEIRNRKEFNKVKDLLEYELKEVKDRARDSQVKLNSNLAESDAYKKRINQLEEKVTRLEKNLQEKDKEIDDIIKNKKDKDDAEKNISIVSERGAKNNEEDKSIGSENIIKEIRNEEAKLAEDKGAETNAESDKVESALPESLPIESEPTKAEAEEQISAPAGTEPIESASTKMAPAESAQIEPTPALTTPIESAIEPTPVLTTPIELSKPVNIELSPVKPGSEQQKETDVKPHESVNLLNENYEPSLITEVIPEFNNIMKQKNESLAQDSASEAASEEEPATEEEPRPFLKLRPDPLDLKNIEGFPPGTV